jgi:hypothetical protein
MFRLRTALLPLIPVVAGFALTACSDGLEEAVEGDFRCEGTCTMEWFTVDPRRPEYSDTKVIVTNAGAGTLLIRNVYLEETSPLIRFSDSTVTNVITRSGYEWSLAAGNQAFEPGGVDIELAKNELLEFELLLEPSAGEGLQCPSGDPGACGFLVIESNDRDFETRTLRVPIEIGIGAGTIVVEPTIIDFPEPVPGQTFEETFTIENTGSGTLTVNSFTVSVPEVLQAADESGRIPPIQIPANGEITINVTWTPTDTTALSGTIIVDSDDQSGARPSVIVRSGTGVSPVLEVDPCNMSFEDVSVGTPAEQLFDVRNAGGGTLTWSMSMQDFSPIDARDEYALQTSDGLATSGNQQPIDAGNSRAFKLVYTPTTEGTTRGRIAFRGNFGTTQYCDFSAGPPSPQIEVLPLQLAWGGLEPGDSEDRSFVIANYGNGTLDISSLDLSETGDGNADEYTIDASDAAGFEVGPGEERRVLVTFTRADGDVAAQDRGTITINHNDSAVGPVSVRLEANHGGEFLPPTCEITVDAAEPYSVGQTVSFTAVGSVVNAGAWIPNPFTWTLVSPAASTARLSAATTVSPEAATTLTFDEPGQYSVSLTATALVDSAEISCEVTRNLTVTD